MNKQLLLVCLIVGYISAIGLVPPVCVASSGTSVVTPPTVSITGTITVNPSGAYSPTTGISLSWGSGSAGNTFMAAISGWPKNDSTVMELIIEQTTLDCFRNITVSPSAKVIVASSFTSLTSSKTSFYFGFKASQGSINLEATVNGSSGTFTAKLNEYGWNDGTTCQSMCSKTLYAYNYLNADIPGQYDCFGNNLIVSGILILLTLLF